MCTSALKEDCEQNRSSVRKNNKMVVFISIEKTRKHFSVKIYEMIKKLRAGPHLKIQTKLNFNRNNQQV